MLSSRHIVRITTRGNDYENAYSKRNFKMKYVFLVSCVKKKQCCPAPAKKIYLSDLFKKSRRLVEATKCPWFILSAKHGLLHPDKVICPYNETLNQMPQESRKEWKERLKAWAKKVKLQMVENLPDAEAVVILAGKNYYECLTAYLEERFGSANVKIPMEGMLIGKRLNWLDNAEAKIWSCKCQDSDEGDKE